MKRFGYFGGTFDPIHFGHLNFLIQMVEMHNLDKLFICPTGLSPTKVQIPPLASFEHRYNMVNLACQDIPYVEVLDWEKEEEDPSYTIDTMKRLKESLSILNESFTLNLILADDLLSSFSHWKEPDELAMLFPILVGTRTTGTEKIHLTGALKKSGVEITDVPLMEISSTIIRDRLKKNLYCGHLVPHKVLQYIKEFNLYV